MLSFPVTFWGGGRATLTLMQASTPINGAHSTATFNNVNIGTAAADRYVLFVMMSQTAVAGRTLSTLTIDGGSPDATPIAFTSEIAAANTLIVRVAGKLITTGTDADFVASFSGNMTTTMLHTYTLTGAQSNTPDFTATNASNAAVANISTTIDIPANGALLVAGGSSSTGVDLTAGATEDANSAAGSSSMATGIAQELPSQTARTLTVARTGPGTMNAAICGLSWN